MAAMQVLLGRDLSDQFAVVTGANSGIGYETARSLALHGAHVVLACRDSHKAAAALQKIRQERPSAKVTNLHLDLNCLASVKNFANAYIGHNWPLHLLILNAGVFGLPYSQTEDGFETTFQTNHLGHFYLTQLLMGTLKKSAPGRVISVSAESHRFTDLSQSTICETLLSPPEDGYRAIYSYNQSKLCNILMSQELHRRLSSCGVMCHAVHPGNVVSTGLPRHSWFYRIIFTAVRPFAKSQQQAAATSVFCATAQELENFSGYYFNNCFQCQPSGTSLSTELASRLWELSERMVNKARTLQQI
ncbi:hypothetical protein CAPTEDRAFT_150180 [Capitella teleta]|uniref:WW domain-containing oxidoreductase n=1 Tax=Capitella teleta TaxID=283909 RepID=R7URT1_CAPTE|nr:hypothetical protein CAPTEDRAFT_150180 [Capitella teleta]|eukprot:ELU06617.1 hypothetical protein CAPTEDRAFT_150180 [Capitella teleta]